MEKTTPKGIFTHTVPQRSLVAAGKALVNTSALVELLKAGYQLVVRLQEGGHTRSPRLMSNWRRAEGIGPVPVRAVDNRSNAQPVLVALPTSARRGQPETPRSGALCSQ